MATAYEEADRDNTWQEKIVAGICPCADGRQIQIISEELFAVGRPPPRSTTVTAFEHFRGTPPGNVQGRSSQVWNCDQYGKDGLPVYPGARVAQHVQALHCEHHQRLLPC